MTPSRRDANGLTPTEVKVARLVAKAGRIDRATVNAIAEEMGYGHPGPVDGFIRAIRIKLDCTLYQLPEELQALGYHEEDA